MHGDKEYNDFSKDLATGDKAPLTIGQTLFKSNTGYESTTCCVTNLQIYDVAFRPILLPRIITLQGWMSWVKVIRIGII